MHETPKGKLTADGRLFLYYPDIERHLCGDWRDAWDEAGWPQFVPVQVTPSRLGALFDEAQSILDYEWEAVSGEFLSFFISGWSSIFSTEEYDRIEEAHLKEDASIVLGLVTQRWDIWKESLKNRIPYEREPSTLEAEQSVAPGAAPGARYRSVQAIMDDGAAQSAAPSAAPDLLAAPSDTSASRGSGHAFFINSNDEITIIHNGVITVVAPDHPKNAEAQEALHAADFGLAVRLADIRMALREFFSQDSEIRLSITHSHVLLDGEPLPTELGQHVVKLIEQDASPSPLLRFLRKMRSNPIPRIREQLLSFIAANDFRINEDGLIVAWKKVNNDMTDLWTRRLDYTPPRTITMPAEMVLNDPENSCGAGLHFATWKYTYSYNGYRVIEMLVDPRDVVNVPFSETEKGRAHTVVSVREIEDWEQYRDAPPPQTGQHSLASLGDLQVTRSAT